MNFYYKYNDLNLGGAITFRKECEMLAQLKNKKKIKLFFTQINKKNKKFYNEIFKYSDFNFSIFKYKSNISYSNILENINAPSYSLAKINHLYKKHKINPVLKWSKKKISFVKKKMKKININNKVITVHLKYISPISHIGNAKLKIWSDFFKKYKNITFILIGHDNYKNYKFSENVKLFSNFSQKLSDHLILPLLSDGFMGTASGITTAVNFSKVPYIIFKHPKHHVKAMKNELFKGNYIFAQKRQKIIRKVPSSKILSKYLKYILNKGQK